MAEYYAVLKKAVGGLEGASSETRRAVYDKARNALIGQLKAIDPPLSTSEISRQRLELEEAIRRVERESAMEAQSARARHGDSTPVRDAILEAPAGPNPQDVFRRAIQDAETRASAGPYERAPLQGRGMESYGGEPRERVERAPPPDYPPYRPQEPDYRSRTASAPPRLAPEYDEEPPRHPPHVEMPASTYVDHRDYGRQATRVERRSYLDDDDVAIAARPARRSRLPGILLTLLIIAIIAGLAAVGWTQRAKISEVIASFDKGATTAPAAKPPAEEESAAPGKVTDRVGGDEAPAVREDNARVVQPEAPPPPSQDSASLGAVEPDTSASEPSGPPLVAQKAALLEEQPGSTNGQNVVSIDAHVTWEYKTGNDGPEITANVEVPERQMKIRISIRKNSDATLPASHLVEAVIDTPSDFPGQGIRLVPRLVMKPSEDTRGQALIGASAKVADGFFWIALSAAEADIATNLKLMREATWVDMPIVYENGQRAILTMEKGTPGTRAFETALASWGG